jgi:hypothetical protein
MVSFNNKTGATRQDETGNSYVICNIVGILDASTDYDFGVRFRVPD